MSGHLCGWVLAATATLSNDEFSETLLFQFAVVLFVMGRITKDSRAGGKKCETRNGCNARIK